MRYLLNLVIGILLVILLLIHAFCLTFTFTDVKFPYYQVNKDFLPSAIFGTGVLVALLTFIRENLKQEGETGERSPLPPQFFYGVSDWKLRKPLDDVAIQAYPEGEVYEKTIDQLTPGAGLKPIAPNYIVAIYDFMDYSEDYNDPLDAVTVWSNDWLDSYGHSEGTQKYVAHRNKYRVEGSKLLEKNSKSH